jgi:hypothetical protein
MARAARRGTTADASRRQRDLRARLDSGRARARRPSEAQALERWRDFAGAARAYASLGEKAQALRLQLLADTTAAARTRDTARDLRVARGNPSPTDARVAITLVDSSLGPLSSSEAAATLPGRRIAPVCSPRACRLQVSNAAGRPDRYAYGVVLSRLGRDAEAARSWRACRRMRPLVLRRRINAHEHLLRGR